MVRPSLQCAAARGPATATAALGAPRLPQRAYDRQLRGLQQQQQRSACQQGQQPRLAQQARRARTVLRSAASAAVPWCSPPATPARATCRAAAAACLGRGPAHLWGLRAAPPPAAAAPSLQRIYRRSPAAAPPAAVAVAVAPPAPIATAASSAAVAAVGGGAAEVVAVALGYCVLAGSLFRSAPQIIKVVRARSCEGLSLTSVIVELLCYSIVVAYNLSQGYAFNTFGEVAACWVQDVVLIALILRFSHAPAWVAAAVFGSLALLSAWLLSPACPGPMLAALQASTILTMALGSRLPQIVLNWRRGNAGMLSVMSCSLNVAGNAARIFTTLVLTRDPLLLGGILTQGTMNCILLYQSIDTSLRRRRGLLPPIPRAPPRNGKAAQPQQAAAQQQQQGPGADGGNGGASSVGPALVPQPAAS